MKWLFVPLFAALVGLVGIAPLAYGQDTDANKWQYRFTPYAWGTSIKGTRGIRGVEVETDASFLDLVDKSDSLVAFMAYSEARKGKLSIFLDTIWASITASGDGVRGRNFGPLNITVGGGADLKYQYAVIGGGINYEVARWGSGQDLKDGQYVGTSTALDLMIGGRFWYQEAELDLNVTAAATLPAGFSRQGSLFRSGSVSESWFDPVFGVRIRHRLDAGQEFIVLGDVGGFGIGSDVTWQVLAAYSFEFAKRDHVTFAGVVGYRALYADYAEGSGSNRYVYEELQHGPVLGISMRF